MSSKAMSLKGRIKNYANKNKIAAQLVLQNYMFERFLERLSQSEYQKKFVIKGGMLISTLVGLDTRTTMDLDATLRNLPLTKAKMQETITAICNIKINDDVSFNFKSIGPIRKDDAYGGFRVRLDAVYEKIITPLSIDISTGDIITPDAVEYEFSGIFADDVRIKIWGYNIESIMSEKVEAILSRGVFSTRPRDFYDIFILFTTQKFSQTIFLEALKQTAQYRGTLTKISKFSEIIETISMSDDLKTKWEKYRAEFSYAKDIEYDAIIDILRKILCGQKI